MRQTTNNGAIFFATFKRTFLVASLISIATILVSIFVYGCGFNLFIYLGILAMCLITSPMAFLPSVSSPYAGVKRIRILAVFIVIISFLMSTIGGFAY